MVKRNDRRDGFMNEYIKSDLYRYARNHMY